MLGAEGDPWDLIAELRSRLAEVEALVKHPGFTSLPTWAIRDRVLAAARGEGAPIPSPRALHSLPPCEQCGSVHASRIPMTAELDRWICSDPKACQLRIRQAAKRLP